MELKVSEGKVYGARYYTVEPVASFPYDISWYEMIDWTEQAFGPSEGSIWFSDKQAPQPAQRWYTNNSKFWFRNKQDMEWFILRWT